ncbi:hypothetical protein C0J50_19217 [Silurus asotus]|uniref:Uncharacterized protein n=1 Tax=Silurus asotus TaxID=30991 RepID=A0AAD5FMR7_SILAS|nr:hypothetical protein C0J50_19217 [Silurus asotus]
MRSSLCAGDYASVYVQPGVRGSSASFIQSGRGALRTTSAYWLSAEGGAELRDAEQKRHRSESRENPWSLPKDTPQPSYRHKTSLTTCGLSFSDNERGPSMFQSTESASEKAFKPAGHDTSTIQGFQSANLAERGQLWGREDWQLQASRGNRGAVSPWSSNLPPGGIRGGDLSWVESSACLSRASHCSCYIAVILTH